MRKMLAGLIFVFLDFNLVLQDTGRMLEMMPAFLGHFLILAGMSEVSRESTHYRKQWVKIFNFGLFVLSMIVFTVQFFYGSQYGYVRYLSMLASLLFHVQVYIITRGLIDIDNNYFLKAGSSLLLSLLIVMAGVELVVIIMELFSISPMYEMIFTLIHYVLALVYLVKYYDVYKGYKRALK